jgi:hypothetical protein
MDQYISGLHGRLPHTKGKEAKSKKFTGGTIFVDHASGLIHHRHQVSLRSGETLKGKHAFEHFSAQHGVRITAYHADNHPFNSEQFRQDLENKRQTITSSGVGAHHQNGIAERNIQTFVSWARTMMLHAVIHWPDQANLELWPFALDHAIYLWNNIPSKTTRLSPLELFTKSRFDNYDHLQRARVWGCPTYVLDPKLQDAKKIPKWHPRARRGMNLGVSSHHSTRVGLVLNVATGSVSPQFHCVYDDLFSTVPNAESGGLLFNDHDTFDIKKWNRLIQSGHELSIEQEWDADGQPIPLPELDDEWLSAEERRLRAQLQRERRANRLRAHQEWDALRQRELIRQAK